MSTHLTPINFSSSPPYIFIHIPKTGGSSIAHSLNIKKSSHATALEARKKLYWWQYRRSFKFALVRNPWDRFLSLYNYARMPENLYHSAINPEKSLYGKHQDYDLLKNASLEDCARYLMEGKLKHSNIWNHWQPQVNWLLNKHGKIDLDYIGRFEDIQNEINYIFKKLKIHATIQHLNASRPINQKSYKEAFTEKSKEIIFNFYQKDIQLFNYQF